MRASVSLPSLPPKASTGSATASSAPHGDSTLHGLGPKRSPALPPTIPYDHSTASSGDGEDDERPRGGYASQFRAQAKRSLVDVDVGPLLARFEDAALFHNPHRKPLTVVLHEMADAQHRRQSAISSTADTSAARIPSPVPAVNAPSQATTLVLTRRSRPRQSLHGRILGVRAALGAPAAASAPLEAPAGRRQAERDGVLPSRVLFDDSRWPRGARCDYCQLAGGDLACATCDVVAHAPCFLADFGARAHKQKAAFVAPTRFSWLCAHCQRELQAEYDARAATERARQLAARRLALGHVVAAYLRMAKDARLFARKKLAAVRIQAVARGRLARRRVLRLQRTRVRPYTLEGLHVLGRVGTAAEELRLANGFSCNPFLYVTVTDGEDDSRQLFCFETALRRGLCASTSSNGSSSGSGSGSGSVGGRGGGDSAHAALAAWADKLFVPGMDGNATVAVTLLSKNGPNRFFLGQAVLRLLDVDGHAWRDGAALELPLRARVEIAPKTAQKQPLRLAHPLGAPGASPWASQAPSAAARDAIDVWREEGEEGPVLRLGVALRPLRGAQTHCGYLGLKATLDGFHASPRWCVLADGVLRVYRHYGVTVASEAVDMARALDVRLERGQRSQRSCSSSHAPIRSSTGAYTDSIRSAARRKHGEESAAKPPLTTTAAKVVLTDYPKGRKRRGRDAGAPNCVVVELVARVFVFECERAEAARAWHKKLQAAQRQSASAATAEASARP